jgi:integrase
VRLTDSKIKSLKPREMPYIIGEDGGMGIRVYPSGKRSFVYMYRFDDTPRLLTIGAYPLITLHSARLDAAKAKDEILRGIDPAKAKKNAKETHRDAETVKALVAEFIEKWSKPRKRTWKEDERILKKDVIPAFGRRKAKDIKRRDIIHLIDGIVERGAPIQANRALAVIRKMFNFAVTRSILDASPCAAIAAPSKENRRERVLDDDEIKAFWLELDQAKMHDMIKMSLKLMLVTAQRKQEVSNAKWDEFDLKSGWWTIPSERSKNGHSHRVPIASMAKELLTQIKKSANSSDFLFPSPRTDSPITGQSIDHALRKNVDCFSIPAFTPHDLRRTASSKMTESGISSNDVSKVLNHSEGTTISRHYDHYSYDKEKKSALAKWSRTLDSIISGKSKKKVIQL